MKKLCLSAVIVFCTASGLLAQDWANWRGPEMSGISRETNLVEDFSLKENKNILWKSDTGGRATPIVLNGRVFLNCRTEHDFNDPDEKIHCREQVVCWDAQTGKEMWKDEFNVFQTDIPAPRVGWAAMAGDKETGYVYMHSVSGIFKCYDGDGKIIWERSLLEDYGKISGYGGRTQTPIIDEDRVIVSYLAANWGETKGPAPKHYYYAFDKKTGELQWVSAPGGAPKDTNYSIPIVKVINGQRLLIGGNSDGGLYAMNARTGAPVWGFQLSRRGLNSSPVVDGNLVYISHGEDNIDNTEFGRIQCIDANGTGDITKTNSVWRIDGIKAGYTGLLVKDGILYVVADTGNMHAFDSKTGAELWTHNLGTVGKGSPVWADGKIYVTETNGRIWILKPSREGCETLSHCELVSSNGKGLDEIYSSPAISNGRIYFVTRDRTFCVTDKSKKAEIGTPEGLAEETAADGVVATVQIRPYEVLLKPGEKADFMVHKFDKNGRSLGSEKANLTAGETLGALQVSGSTVSVPADAKAAAGTVSQEVDGITATARVRTMQSGNVWSWNFDDYKSPVQVPSNWMRAFAKLKPVDVEGGGKALQAAGMGKGKGRPSHAVWLGTSDMKDYTVQADVMMREQRRQLPRIGLCANRYNFIMNGNRSRLQIQSWAPHLRMATDTKFVSDPDVWYTMKMKVDVKDGKAMVYGKVWKRGDEEPKEWSLTAEDPHANESGSPGLYVYAQADCLFDNVSVTFDK